MLRDSLAVGEVCAAFLRVCHANPYFRPATPLSLLRTHNLLKSFMSWSHNQTAPVALTLRNSYWTCADKLYIRVAFREKIKTTGFKEGQTTRAFWGPLKFHRFHI